MGKQQKSSWFETPRRSFVFIAMCPCSHFQSCTSSISTFHLFYKMLHSYDWTQGTASVCDLGGFMDKSQMYTISGCVQLMSSSLKLNFNWLHEKLYDDILWEFNIYARDRKRHEWCFTPTPEIQKWVQWKLVREASFKINASNPFYSIDSIYRSNYFSAKNGYNIAPANCHRKWWIGRQPTWLEKNVTQF